MTVGPSSTSWTSQTENMLSRTTVEYLNLQGEEVPSQFVEQYRLLRRKKDTSLKGDLDFPDEVLAIVAQIRSSQQKASQNQIVDSPLEPSTEGVLPQLTLEDFLPGAAQLALEEHKSDEDDDQVAATMLQVRLKAGQAPTKSPSYGQINDNGDVND